MATLSYQSFKDNISDFHDYVHPLDKVVRKCYKFYALEQWEENDKKKLETELRPALVFDNTRPVIDFVGGSEVSNRFETKFYPRNVGFMDIDLVASEAMGELYRWVRDASHTEHQESSAFHDLLICGYGVTDTYIDYSEDSDGRIVTKRKPIWQVGWDPSAQEQNLVDADHVFQDKWVPEATFNAKWPEADSYKAASWDAKGSSIWDRITTSFTARDRVTYRDTRTTKFYDGRNKKVHMWDYQWRVLTPQVRVLIPDMMGGQQEIWLDKNDETNTRLTEIIEINAQMNQGVMGMGMPPVGEVQWMELDRYKYYRAMIAGKDVLEEEEIPIRDFSLKFMTGFEDWSEEERKYHFGIMLPMIDPQTYVNKFYSQAVHIWSSSPKGILLYESDLFENPQRAMEEWSKPDGAVPVRPGSISMSLRPKFEHVRNSTTFAGAESLFRFAEDAIPKAAGVNTTYSVGLSQDLRRTAASAVQSVQENNFLTLSIPFDALREYRKRQAELVLKFIREYMPDEQVIRVLGPTGPQAVQITRDEKIAEYDVVVDEAPTSPNRKREVFEALVQTNLLGTMLEMGIVPPSLFNYLPLPSDVAQEIGMMMGQQQMAQEQLPPEQTGAV